MSYYSLYFSGAASYPGKTRKSSCTLKQLFVFLEYATFICPHMYLDILNLFFMFLLLYSITKTGISGVQPPVPVSSHSTLSLALLSPCPSLQITCKCNKIQMYIFTSDPCILRPMYLSACLTFPLEYQHAPEI